MILSIIAAYAKDEKGRRVIGLDNSLPWHFPHDLERFKEYTSGCAVIMGRKTHESIGRILPNRDHIIITRQDNYEVPGALVFNDLDKAISFSGKRNSEVFIIGGQELYEQTIDRAHRLYLTSFRIPEVEGDTYFPAYHKGLYKVIHLERAGINGDCFRILERKASSEHNAHHNTTTSPTIAGMHQTLVADTRDNAYDYDEDYVWSGYMP